MTLAALESRWYRDIVTPVRGPIEAVVRRVRRPEIDPWTLPRTGLGGALVLQVARGFGTRRWQEGARVGTFAIEAYNYRLHQPSPSRAARSMWLERDFERVRRVWKSLLEREDALVERVLRRLFGSDAIADSKVPEAVLFLRASAAAGVLAGDVPDAIHAELDRVMTYLGLAWEDAHGTLDQAGWMARSRRWGSSRAVKLRAASWRGLALARRLESCQRRSRWSSSTARSPER